MTTVRSAAFALFCVLVMAAIVVPAARAQRKAMPESRSRDARTLAQEKINGRVLSAIYHRRGDAKGKTVRVVGSAIQKIDARVMTEISRRRGDPRQHAPIRRDVRVDRHGRALVDVRAQVRPALEKKIKALGGIIVSTSGTYDSIVGWMPLLTLERLAADKTVRAIEPAQ